MMEKNRDCRSQLLEDPAYALEAAKGDLIMDVTESICDLLEKEGIERQELAERMNKTKGFISQLLNGSRNMTLATLAEMAHALNYTPTISFEKKGGKKMVLDCVEMDLEKDTCDYECKTKVA